MPIGNASSAEAIESDSGSPSPSESSVTLSSDQILDNAFSESGSDEVQAPADDDAPTTPNSGEGKASEAKATPAEKSESAKPDPDERFAEQALPESWKTALKAIKAIDGPVGKQIQAEHYQLAQYKDALPLEDAREMRSIFPSVDEARSARQASADLMALDYSLKNDPQKFIGYIRDYNPQAFANIAQEFPRWVYDSDPDFYRQTIAQPAVDRYLAHWEAQGTQTGDDILNEAVAVLRERTEKWSKSPGPSPEEPLRARLSEYESRERQLQEHGVQTFTSDIGRSYSGKLDEQITRALDAAGATGLSKDARREVAMRVAGEIGQVLQQDQYIQNYIQFSARSGPRDSQHQQKIVDYLISRARPLLGQKVKEQVTWMTDNIVQANGARLGKERQVASQKPVTTGVAAGPKPARAWAGMSASDRRSMSPDQILEAAARGELG